VSIHSDSAERKTNPESEMTQQCWQWNDPTMLAVKLNLRHRKSLGGSTVLQYW